jgi:hypothetical protein
MTTVWISLPKDLIKVGFDYNAYENWLDMENVISIGMRYGLVRLAKLNF